ncbi:MAG: 3-hydroxyacyl-ACP dehydratase FabZ family protein [Fibrobacterota bacterium]
MPPKTILPPEQIDISNIIYKKADVLRANPQRYEFEQIDGIVHFDPGNKTIAGVKYQKEEEFWTRGHLPGNPLMPGVLMIEAAAQLGSFYFHHSEFGGPGVFFGFGGVDRVKFRKTVKPGETLLIVAQNTKLRSRAGVFYVQAFVENVMVFEGEITGRIF